MQVSEEFKDELEDLILEHCKVLQKDCTVGKEFDETKEALMCLGKLHSMLD